MATSNHPAGAVLRPVLLALACLLPACDGGEDLQGTDPPAVAEVTVNAPATTIAVGDSVQLEAVALDAAGNAVEDRAVEWTSADSRVAAVSSSGMVTGLREGEAAIGATVDEIAGAIAITVTATAPPAPPPPPGSGAPGLEPIASGLAFPLDLTSPPDDDRLFVVEKGGTIRIIADGAVLAEPFLDLSGRVAGRAEQGLLGLAFFPD